MAKIDYKKDFKSLYIPKAIPMFIDIPKMTFATLEGQGDPNLDEFALATQTLYALSYAVKMSYKSSMPPEGYYEYTVFPLEGVWDLVDKSKGIEDKSNLAYKIMIRQPDFLTPSLFHSFVASLKLKKPELLWDFIKLEVIEEGQCCQMLHLGSYDQEPESFEKMEKFCSENGVRRHSKLHREIYLSDPRKTEASKLKTVLRFKIDKNEAY